MILFKDAMLSALDSLRSNPARSFMAIATVAAGVGAVSTMSSLARSGLAELSRTFAEVGAADMVAVFPKAVTPGRGQAIRYAKGLIHDDARFLRTAVSPIQAVAAYALVGKQELARVQSPRKDHLADVIAGNGEFLPTFKLGLAAGRGIAATDLERKARVAVVGATTAIAIFGSSSAALGQSLRVNGSLFSIVGVAQPTRRSQSEFGFDWNDFLLAPLTTLERQPDGIFLATGGSSRNPAIVAQVQRLLDRRHQQVDDFRVLDLASIQKDLDRISGGAETIAAVIAGVALVAGCAGIVGILLVSLNRRIVEIGMRRAIGATATSVALQFMAEGALLSLMGSLVGVAGSLACLVGAAGWISRTIPSWTTFFAGETTLVAVVLTVLVGMLCGLVPARRAVNRTVASCLTQAV